MNESPQKEDACPHCGSQEGTWFDKSTTFGQNEYEDHANRCNACGKNVNAPKSYYKEVKK